MAQHRHRLVLGDEQANELDAGFVEPRAGPGRLGDPRALSQLIAKGLARVVEQGCEVEGPRIVDPEVDRGRHRVVAAVVPADAVVPVAVDPDVAALVAAVPDAAVPVAKVAVPVAVVPVARAGTSVAKAAPIARAVTSVAKVDPIARVVTNVAKVDTSVARAAMKIAVPVKVVTNVATAVPVRVDPVGMDHPVDRSADPSVAMKKATIKRNYDGDLRSPSFVSMRSTRALRRRAGDPAWRLRCCRKYRTP